MSGFGAIAGGAHRLPVRVYYEDTDAGGVVYHANYLRFMERGRSEMVAALGIDQERARTGGAGVFVVADLAIRYRRPARLGDDLEVVTRVRELGAASMVVHQAVRRGAEGLADADVRIGFVDPDGRPRRLPIDWAVALRHLLAGQEGTT